MRRHVFCLNFVRLEIVRRQSFLQSSGLINLFHVICFEYINFCLISVMREEQLAIFAKHLWNIFISTIIPAEAATLHLIYSDKLHARNSFCFFCYYGQNHTNFCIFSARRSLRQLFTYAVSLVLSQYLSIKRIFPSCYYRFLYFLVLCIHFRTPPIILPP